MSEFLAMLYDKDGKTKERLDKDEYDRLKETGEWFDSQKEAMEAGILKAKKKLDKAKQKDGDLITEEKNSQDLKDAAINIEAKK